MGIGIPLVILGAFILSAIAFRWQWVMNHFKVKRTYGALGETGGNAFYILMGIGFLALGILAIVRAV